MQPTIRNPALFQSTQLERNWVMGDPQDLTSYKYSSVPLPVLSHADQISEAIAICWYE